MEYYIAFMSPDDWEQVRSIYQEGIETGNATFESRTPDWDAWDTGHLPDCRLSAKFGDEVLGWAALSPVSTRRVFSGVAEVSIYLREKHRGQGIGGALLSALVRSTEEHGLWTLQAKIFPENKASIKLHRQFGFREVGRRERMAKMSNGPFAGKWRDVVLMERRSETVGVEDLPSSPTGSVIGL